jgi:uncharacterized FlaG/YvyC family protein
MSISSTGGIVPGIVPHGPSAPAPISQEQRSLIQAVKAVNAAEIFGQDREITFVMDRSAKRMVTRIVNRSTGEVVDQIPPEYVLRLAEENKGR